MRTARRSVRFWDGRSPDYDVSILMTAYNAEETIEEAVRSIYAQEVEANLRAQLIIGVDPCPDATLAIAEALAEGAPPWLRVEVLLNPLPNLEIDGRRTARSNFMHAYAHVRGGAVAFLNCDDRWETRTKLQAQLDEVRSTGKACATSLDTEAHGLRKLNEVPEVQDPFTHGTTVLFSSFMMPYWSFGRRGYWWKVGFLDLPVICYCYERFGITRLTDEVTFYRYGGGGAWSRLTPEEKSVWIRRTGRRMALSGPYRLRNRRAIDEWASRQ
jgi:glycosyltransferase involved in cell wall biosynthesis